MNRYSYDGPVVEFGTCIANHWKGETCAETSQKARNNLAYQYKKQHNKIAGTKIVLPGKLTIIY